MSDAPKTCLTDGSPVTPEALEIDPATGKQRGYVVLTDEERAKGWVRPYRDSYVHVGCPGSKHPLRDLTDEEKERFKTFGYVKFEPYPESESPVTGRYWTQADLDGVRTGCGVLTKMSRPIAETYARDPKFYGATYCCGCNAHLPVDQFVWEGTTERLGS